MRTALIVGATGVVGWALKQRLEANAGWRVLGIARRMPPGAGVGSFLAADLFDIDALNAARDQLRAVTHVFVTLRVPGNDPVDEVRQNLVPLENLLNVLAAAGADIQRVCLVHGTKWYGSHVGAYETPAKERHPRRPIPLYYYDQHDLVTRFERELGWGWTTLRPHTVWGRSEGTGNSLVMGIGAYAQLMKSEGRPLTFPGPAGTWSKLSQGITAEVLAEALEWAATAPACANQDFNITNGDSFRWEHLWPKIAAFFDMPAGGVETTCLGDVMPAMGDRWRTMAESCDLAEGDLSSLVNWSYIDGLLKPTWDDLSSVVKARSAGFTTTVDSEDAFLACLASLRDTGFLPKL